MLDRIAVPTSLDVELKIKLFIQGANAGERLSFGLNGKGLRGNAIAANPALAGEIRPSGMRGGACGNVSYGGIRNPPHIPKGCGAETLCL